MHQKLRKFGPTCRRIDACGPHPFGGIDDFSFVVKTASSSRLLEKAEEEKVWWLDPSGN
jgi:hypothetical protein